MATDQIWIIKQINFQEFYFPLIVDLLFIIVLFALGKYLLKKGRKPFTAYLFFLIWFLSGMAVYSQIFPLNQTVADHWFYFSIIGLLGVIGIALQKLNFEKKNFAKTALTLGFIVIILFSVRSIVRNANWVDTMTLFIHDSKVDDNYDKEAILGIQYLNQSQYYLALEHFLKADNYYSYDGDLLNTASTYLDLGDVQKAIEYIQLAKAHPGYNVKNLKSDLQYAYDNESLYIAIHYPQKAPDFIQYSLRDFPKDPSLWADLAIAYYTINDQNGALNAAKKAYELLPNGKTEYLFTQISSKQPLDINDLFR